MRSLKELVEAVREYPGVLRKKYAGYFSKLVNSEFYGEDAAYIKTGDEYIIFATDSVWHRVIVTDLYWAGFVSILVNVHDIYAMGGKPIAALNVVSARNKEELREIARGIRDACEKFDVKIVGGHVHPDAKIPSIDVSMMGKARKVLRSDTAEEGDSIILAADVEGVPHPKLPYNFDSTKKSKEILLEQFESMVEIAERGLANAAKDVSNAGILGTIAMMMEVSKKGCEIYVDRIFKPKNVDFTQWILSYPACAFVVAGKNDREIIEVFEAHGLKAEKIGRVTGDRRITLKLEDEEETLFDLNRESVLEIRE